MTISFRKKCIVGFILSITGLISFFLFTRSPPIQWIPFSESQVKIESKKHKVLISVVATWALTSTIHEHNFIDTPAVRKVIYADGVRCFRLDLVDLQDEEIKKWNEIFNSRVPMGALIYQPDNPNVPTILNLEKLSEEKVLDALR